MAENTAGSAPRPLHQIADEIYRDWQNVNYAARPYLEAMRHLNQVTDNYGMDDARSIVLYFLGNARSWRGPVAQRIRAELRGMI